MTEYEKNLFNLIKDLIDANFTSLESRLDDIAKAAARAAVTDMMPSIKLQLQESGKQIVADARDKLVIELTGEDYTDRRKIRNGVQWSIKSAGKATMARNSVLTAIISSTIGAMVAWVIGKW